MVFLEVPLRVWDYDKYNKVTSLKLDYTHPNPTSETETLNLFLYDGHYTILMFDEFGDDDASQLKKIIKLSTLEALQDHQWRLTYHYIHSVT